MQSTPNAPSAVNLSDMHHLQSTSAASVYPNAPASAPSVPSAVSFSERGEGGGEAAELPDRSRWFHRVGDFFLGAPSLDLPVTAPAVHPTLDLLVGHPPPLTGGGDQDTTTTEAHTNEVPVIRWFCAFDFQRGDDNEALVADGWRWRMQVFFAVGVMLCAVWSVIAMVDPEDWIASVLSLALWVALAAAATVLAVFQNSSCLRRSTAATMLHVILHLTLLAVCIITLLIDTDWDWVFSSPNVSSVGGGTLSPLSSNTIMVTLSFDAWVRREIALYLCLTTYFTALLLPVSRGGRWLGIVFQVMVVPAIQVCGERGGGGKSVVVTRYEMCVFPQLYSDTSSYIHLVLHLPALRYTRPSNLCLPPSTPLLACSILPPGPPPQHTYSLPPLHCTSSRVSEIPQSPVAWRFP